MEGLGITSKENSMEKYLIIAFILLCLGAPMIGFNCGRELKNLVYTIFGVLLVIGNAVILTLLKVGILK